MAARDKLIYLFLILHIWSKIPENQPLMTFDVTDVDAEKEEKEWNEKIAEAKQKLDAADTETDFADGTGEIELNSSDLEEIEDDNSTN